MHDISVNLGGSLFYPSKLVAISGLSLVYLFPEALNLGVVLNSAKIKCAECNTPIAEITGGSLVIRSRHHSQKHVTALPLNRIQDYTF